MSRHFIALHTRTPLHVGCGSSVDIVDLPINRERVTKHPNIPASGLKGVLRQAARSALNQNGAPLLTDAQVRTLFGEDRKLNNDSSKGDIIKAHAGCLQIIEAKLLAFPVRSLKGSFAWLTCPAILHRLHRDTGLLAAANIPDVQPDHALIAPDSELKDGNHIFLEEYRLTADTEQGESTKHGAVSTALLKLCDDTLWKSKLSKRLAILSDEDFQHFVTTCTEIVQRIAIDPATRTVKGTGLFSQENIPCETLFYSVLTLLPARQADKADLGTNLNELLSATLTLQIGGDETTGHGFCSLKNISLDQTSQS